MRYTGCERRLPRRVSSNGCRSTLPVLGDAAGPRQALDGDADLEGGVDFAAFVVLACTQCGGVLKQDVVFIGEDVPRERVSSAFADPQPASAMLVVG
ncbi:Sir2 family NAD-dependent protein deacetylase [Xanthomonas sacchari]|uniref:Sir2 family NAD-dependent protein deacetylase n=1 Tax=Xanthomonas sacchari TaxID=56458 RepID=UPI0031B642E1